MSGDRPLACFIGDLLPSSCIKYFSFWRKTLDTVLSGRQSLSRLLRPSFQSHLRSTPKMAAAMSVQSLIDGSRSRTSDLSLLGVRMILSILTHSFPIEVGQRLSRRRRRPCRRRGDRRLQCAQRDGLDRLHWRRVDRLVVRMRLTAQHRWPLRHDQRLQRRRCGSLLDHASERSWLHCDVGSAKVEAGVLLRRCTVVGVRVDVRCRTPLRRRG